MASNTENLNLLMKNPSTDGADTFNIQTMLNENWQKIDNNAGTVAQTLANILKPTTPPLIGLPPSTTPDGMFQALGNTGELHVWRKTVVSASEKPAGYTLGAETTKTLGLTRNSDSSSWAITVELASSVSVDDAGNVTLVSPSKLSVYAYNAFVDSFSGKFFRLYSIGSSVTESELANNDVYFVPSGNKLILRADASSSKFYLDLGMKLVTGYAKVPAGTTTTYPVSTDPNAYQEGDDAKEAGYVLGDATSMKVISYVGSSGWYVRFYTADSVTVSTDGVPSIIEDNNSAPMISKSSDGSELKGKYIKYHSSYGANTELVEGMIYFVPSDALFTKSNELLTCNKVQLVTGYAAIPAGTTIEYLGKLGDKARAQVVSYVGTGTYGSGKETKIPVDFSPELLIIAVKNAQRRTVYISVPRSGTGLYLSADGSTSIYGESEATVSYVDGKVCIQSYGNEYAQMNVSGYAYIAVALS